VDHSVGTDLRTIQSQRTPCLSIISIFMGVMRMLPMGRKEMNEKEAWFVYENAHHCGSGLDVK
jgi:hypothetical protein